MATFRLANALGGGQGKGTSVWPAPVLVFLVVGVMVIFSAAAQIKARPSFVEGEIRSCCSRKASRTAGRLGTSGFLGVARLPLGTRGIGDVLDEWRVEAGE